MTRILSSTEQSYRFSVRQFQRMMDAGLFGDQKVELLVGRVFPMTDQPPHSFAVHRLFISVVELAPRDRWTVYEEKPILMDRLWAPRPDLAILRGEDLTYASRLPVPGDVALIAEVSDTTYRRDRGLKWRKYAVAGIPCYWIVHLNGPETVAEVWKEPTGKGTLARYTEVVRYSAGAGESIPIVLDGQQPGQIAVSALIPS